MTVGVPRGDRDERSPTSQGIDEGITMNIEALVAELVGTIWFVPAGCGAAAGAGGGGGSTHGPGHAGVSLAFGLTVAAGAPYDRWGEHSCAVVVCR